jgi:hypothetical protein
MLGYNGKPGWTRLNGKAIGLGGDILIKGVPPKSDFTIKAATQKELEELKRRGNKHIAEIKKKGNNVVESTESDTGSNNRSEGSTGDTPES